MNLSKTSAADSTSNARDLTTYWTESSLELSKKLLSHIEIDCAGLDLSLCRPLQVSTTAKSWFSTIHRCPLRKNLSEILFPSSTFSPVGFTDSGSTLVRSKKIRIYPRSEDVLKFRRYCGLTRYWFNKAVEYLKQPGTKAYLPEVRSIQSTEHPGWAFECPQRVREHAMADAVMAVRNAKLKYKKTQQVQEVHYRSRKDVTQRFGFDKQSLKSTSVFGRDNAVGFFPSEEIKPQLENTEIIHENGRWFVIIPQTVNVKIPESQRFDVVALDPGVRTFQTYFSEFAVGKIGCGDFAGIYRLCVTMDKIQSDMSCAGYRARRRLKKALNRLRWKVKDLIDDLHHKTAYFLVTRFSTILIPSFEVQNMVSKLRSKTARSMLTWSHYRFKEFLKSKAEEYSSKVIEVNEAYTSKTCSFCGKVHTIGSKKVLKCTCGISIDRDLNGGRGIFIRNFPIVGGFTRP